jgi:hypothetical protein
VSFKAITALIELESLQRELSQRDPTRQDAEFFQPRLGALIALTSGGILRPGSVSGLYMCTLYSHILYRVPTFFFGRLFYGLFIFCARFESAILLAFQFSLFRGSFLHLPVDCLCFDVFLPLRAVMMPLYLLT